MAKEKMMQGKDTIIHLVREKGSDWKLVKEGEEYDVEVVVQDEEEVLDLAVSLHRTIPLGNWEFGRVGMGIRLGLPLDISTEEKDAVYDSCVEMIDEVLDREEALVKGDKRKKKELAQVPLGRHAFIWMDYGLTYDGKLPKEKHKVDMTSTRLVPRGAQIENYVLQLQEELGKRVFGYKEKTLSDDDVGI